MLKIVNKFLSRFKASVLHWQSGTVPTCKVMDSAKKQTKLYYGVVKKQGAAPLLSQSGGLTFSE